MANITPTQLPGLRDRSALARTSRTLMAIILPQLYKHYVFKGECFQLRKCHVETPPPHILQNVEYLEVKRRDCEDHLYDTWNEQEFYDSLVNSLKHMPNMRTFKWVDCLPVSYIPPRSRIFNTWRNCGVMLISTYQVTHDPPQFS